MDFRTFTSLGKRFLDEHIFEEDGEMLLGEDLVDESQIQDEQNDALGKNHDVMVKQPENCVFCSKIPGKYRCTTCYERICSPACMRQHKNALEAPDR